LILKGTLVLLALLECCTHGIAQTDPLKHHQKLCNFNRDCMNEVNCFTPKSMRGHECPFKDRTGKCFKGVCRKSWPCNRKCGNGGTCQLDLRCNLFGCSSKVVCKTCGQKGGRKLNFYDGQCKPAVQPAVQRSPNDCNWCEWERVGGQCGSKRTRTVAHIGLSQYVENLKPLNFRSGTFYNKVYEMKYLQNTNMYFFHFNILLF